MSRKKSSPFDDFWSFPRQEDTEEQQEEQSPQPMDWSDLFSEMSKTWKAVEPMVKPFMDKFKK
ncbi:hypothetical protein LCL89_07065 [Halobacillus yeomjeoni]|uniref:Uncharacterized protein n=1 Tax=Halobacillus yeomjeoni TaxID=311194 RepID=A0A931MTV0_9BACI|nr:hypothetical protein [Halobacillus yeomjeoni]MBH0228780.1 hypothetical protein [Halobacillus yeomjeoni]MCA0983817.1 hypothetical protein [Halobacillus yeomjeoni]